MSSFWCWFHWVPNSPIERQGRQWGRKSACLESCGWKWEGNQIWVSCECWGESRWMGCGSLSKMMKYGGASVRKNKVFSCRLKGYNSFLISGYGEGESCYRFQFWLWGHSKGSLYVIFARLICAFLGGAFGGLDRAKQARIKSQEDGVAMCRWLFWLDLGS